MSRIQIRRRPYSSVPDDILTDYRLTWSARVVQGWMLGRSEEFKLHVWHVRKTFRLSETQWVRIRRNLQQYGYFLQYRERDPKTGKWIWVNIVTDSPIPPKQGDGPPSHQKPSDGEPSHGDKEDKPSEVIPLSNKTTPLSPQELTAEQEQLVQDELEGRREAAKRGEAPRIQNEVAWIKKLRSEVAQGRNILSEHGKRVRAARAGAASLEARKKASEQKLWDEIEGDEKITSK